MRTIDFTHLKNKLLDYTESASRIKSNTARAIMKIPTTLQEIVTKN